MVPRSLLLPFLVLAASCGSGAAPFGGSGTVTVLAMQGTDISVEVKIDGHIPEGHYFMSGRLTGVASGAAYVSTPLDAIELVGSVDHGRLVDLDGDGDEDVVVTQNIPGEPLRRVDVWLRNGQSLDWTPHGDVPEALLNQLGQSGRALRERFLVEDGRLVRRIRRGDSEPLDLELNVTAGVWVPSSRSTVGTEESGAAGAAESNR